jgi:hypothetical protein
MCFSVEIEVRKIERVTKVSKLLDIVLCCCSWECSYHVHCAFQYLSLTTLRNLYVCLLFASIWEGSVVSSIKFGLLNNLMDYGNI